MANRFTTRSAHQLDAAWIIALWKAIHGGDPAPEGGMLSEGEAVSIASVAANALVGYVAAVAGGEFEALSEEAHAQVGAGLRKIGGELQVKAEIRNSDAGSP